MALPRLNTRCMSRPKSGAFRDPLILIGMALPRPVFLFEQRIDDLQQQRFPAGGGLRNLRVQQQLTLEVERFALQPVVAGELDPCARHAETRLPAAPGAVLRA